MILRGFEMLSRLFDKTVWELSCAVIRNLESRLNPNCQHVLLQTLDGQIVRCSDDDLNEREDNKPRQEMTWS